MARCEYHGRIYGQRGRPSRWCSDCVQATEAINEKKKAKLLEKATKGGALTRVAGRTFVQQEADKAMSAIREAAAEKIEDLKKAAAEELNQDSEIVRLQRDLSQLRAKLTQMDKDLTQLRAPIIAKYDAVADRIKEERSADLGRVIALRNQRLENLEMRCHITVRGKECAKYLDYNGHCPTHGELEEPGSA